MALSISKKFEQTVPRKRLSEYASHGEPMSPLPPQLIHDGVTKTAMQIYDEKTYVVRGSFKTTGAALDAARLQYPAIYEPPKRPRR